MLRGGFQPLWGSPTWFRHKFQESRVFLVRGHFSFMCTKESRATLMCVVCAPGSALGVNEVGNVLTLPKQPPPPPMLSPLLSTRWHRSYSSHELFSLFSGESMYPSARKWTTCYAILDKYFSHLIYKMDIITSSLLRQRTVPDDLLRYGVPFPATL